MKTPTQRAMILATLLVATPLLASAAPIDDARKLHASALKTKAALEQCIAKAAGAPAAVQTCERQHLPMLKQAHSSSAAMLKKMSADDPARAEAQRLHSELGAMHTSGQALVRTSRATAENQATEKKLAPAKEEARAAGDAAATPAEFGTINSGKPIGGSGPAPSMGAANLGRISTGSGTGSGIGGRSRSYGAAAPRRPVALSRSPGSPRSMPSQPDRTSSSEGYTGYGVNPLTDTAKDNLSTFAIDVDTASYTLGRGKLKAGTLPPKDSVRVEEYLNYFRYEYAQPKDGPFAVHLDAAPSPWSAKKGHHIVRVGVQGEQLTAKSRKPVHLTFLVDVSGSMSSANKLPLAQQALKILTNNLRPGDTVALTTYASGTRVVLEPTGMERRGDILAAIDDLRAGGSTAMNDGLGLAYQQALKSFKRGHVNRVIILSDGDANVGPSSQKEIQAQIAKYVQEGVTLSTIGLGMGNYKDNTMEQLANKGNGNNYYIDSADEARKVFGDQLDGTLQVIAKDVKIQVEFNPKAVTQYRLIGYENRDIADKDFRNDRVDAGELGAGHNVTALYEVVLADGAESLLATVRLRHKQPDGYDATEAAFKLTRADLAAKLSDASKDLQFAAAVAAFAEVLRGSPYVEGMSLALVEELAMAGATSAQADRQELIGLIKKARALQKS